VLVVRHGAKFYATQRLTVPAAEVRRLSCVRAQMEEGLRVCKDHLGLTGCQAHPQRAQLHPMTCCLVAFCLLERERHECQLSIYKLRRRLSFPRPLLGASGSRAAEKCCVTSHGRKSSRCGLAACRFSRPMIPNHACNVHQGFPHPSTRRRH
jgi:hypothetical protein